MKIDTVIFDLDGTLLNSIGDIHSSFNYALNICGYEGHTIEEVRSYVGNGIKKAFERSIGENADVGAVDELTEIFKWHYTKHLYELTVPYEGIECMLAELKQKQYKMAIVSNKYNEAVQELNQKFFSEYIDFAVGEGGNVGKKPCVDGIIKALGKMRKGFKNVIYVGDSEVDIKTAENANIPCISVLWGFKTKEFLKENGGKLFAETPSDIVKIIENKLYLL